MVDGKELPGRLLPKEEGVAQSTRRIVRTKRDPGPARVRWGVGLFRTSVFPIPLELLTRKVGRCATPSSVAATATCVEFAYPFSTQKFTAQADPSGSRSPSRSRARDANQVDLQPDQRHDHRREGRPRRAGPLRAAQCDPQNDFRLALLARRGDHSGRWS